MRKTVTGATRKPRFSRDALSPEPRDFSGGPRPGSFQVRGIATGGPGGGFSHGSLLNLLVDDHTQYLLVSGARNLGGTLLPNVSGAYGLGDSTHKFSGGFFVGLTADGLTLSGDVAFTPLANRTIRMTTTDGADTGYLRLSGGGAYGTDRGAGIGLSGNEEAGHGRLALSSGAPGTAGTYDGMITLAIGTLGTVWKWNRAGHLVPVATGTYTLGDATPLYLLNVYSTGLTLNATAGLSGSSPGIIAVTGQFNLTANERIAQTSGYLRLSGANGIILYTGADWTSPYAVIGGGVVRPYTNNTGSLGASSFYWAYLYVQHLTAAGDILPSADSTYNLGSDPVRWATGYFDTMIAASITASGITPTYVLFSGAGGVISGEADFTWTAGTDTLYAKYLQASNLLTFTGTTNVIRPTTADGTDNALMRIYGGGAAGHTRGGQIDLTGNEYGANYEGCLILYAGNPGSTGTYDGMIAFATGANVIRWAFDRAGNLVPITDNAYTIGSTTVGALSLNLSDANTTAPTAEGEVRVNGTARALQHFIGGALHNNGPNLYCGPAAADSASGGGDAAETAFASTYTIPAAYWAAGKGIEIIAAVSGTFASGDAARTITARLRIGGIAGTILCQSIVTNAGIAARYGQAYLRAVLVPRSRANPAVCALFAEIRYSNVSAAGFADFNASKMNALATVPAAISLNTTAAQAVTLTYQVSGVAATWQTDVDFLSVRALL